ncbi:hypothetical protein C1645_422611 [Glomus cerebriforme]|uniref:Uncharacterized protein n=1 Tax=Glomus cerebriforme TaxID=658196 RepID=A0A397SE31_9GLOM|nr:hypothetical protein C1645_422611 [Glomus cerebriforme]
MGRSKQRPARGQVEIQINEQIPTSIWLIIISFLSLLVGIVLTVYYCLIAYYATKDFTNKKIFSVLFILTISNFVGNLIFFITAAKNNNYVDSSTWLFVLIPVIIAFMLGFIRFFYQLMGEKDKITKVVYQRPIRIVWICTQLLFCTIVGPSVLWIKIYLASAIILFTLLDEYKRISKKEITNIFKFQSMFIKLLKSRVKNYYNKINV